MRILVDYRPALRERTGVGEYVHELVRALATAPSAALDRLTLFTTSWRDRPTAELAALLPGVRVSDHRVPVRALTWAWNRLAWPPVEWLAGPTDVVHAATPVSIPARAPVVLTIHDLHFLRHPERMRAEIRRDFPRLVAEHARRAPAIVVSSHYTADDVRRTLGVPADRIHFCPPGAPAWAGLVRARRVATTPGHILFLGTLDARKNVGVLLDAYARLRARVPDAPPLVLAGGVSPEAQGWVERAGHPPLVGHVRIAGYVPDEARRDLLAGAVMLVQPSIDEGFGLPVLEAMASGVPVVVSSGGALPEVAGAAASPVAPDDADGFADEMARLLDPEAARDASARGLARAAGFSWEACAVRVRQAYAAAAEHAA
ncbi:MAG: glycosyltransferase family 1 protein [Vicinamibacterales bacterium]